MKKIFKWTILIGWMVVIFVFSSQPAAISDEKSRFVIYLFNMLGLNLDSAFGDLSNFIVRKAGHLTEYFILSILAYNVLVEEFRVKTALLWAVIVVFLYACTDEFHQTFVPGREGAVRDVIIDTSGGTVASLCRYLYYHHRNTK
jgi:VanZ family protein